MAKFIMFSIAAWENALFLTTIMIIIVLFFLFMNAMMPILFKCLAA